DHPILSSRAFSAASLPPIRRRPNHASRFEGNPKTKLQASSASDPETLQSQVTKTARKRLSLRGLEVLHGRLDKGVHARLRRAMDARERAYHPRIHLLRKSLLKVDGLPGQGPAMTPAYGSI